MPQVKMAAEEVRLAFVQGGERKEFVLSEAPFTIGRKSDKSLVFTESVVSRDHAVIQRMAEGYVLEDQGSKHGTFVNGERVHRKLLQSNDRIDFGSRAGTAYLLFDPEHHESSQARSFLTQMAGRRPSSNIAELEMLTLFVEAARKLNSGGVVEEVLITLLDTLLKLTHAERGFVFTRHEDGTFHAAAGRSERGENLQHDASISNSILQEAIASGSEFLLSGADDFSELANRQSVVAHELRTIICIPLRATEVRSATNEDAAEAGLAEVRTVIYLDAHRITGKLSQVSREILRAIAREAATLLENARLVQSEHAMRHYRQEMAIAASIQQRLMMVEIPEVAFARVDARSIPCTEIGGDFFDVISGADHVTAVVADVSGKGIPAALMASIIQGMLYGPLSEGRSLTEAIAVLNRFLCQRVTGQKYATLLIARLWKNGRLEYVNCGHVPPVVIRKRVAAPLEGSNLPVGLFPEATFTASEMQLTSQERVVVVTDGVTEAENPAGDFYTFEQLQEKAAGFGGIAGLMQAVTEFCQGVPLRDDCTALELLFSGTGAA